MKEILIAFILISFCGCVGFWALFFLFCLVIYIKEILEEIFVGKNKFYVEDFSEENDDS